MIRPIIRDVLFLSRKAEPATRADLAVGQDLRDTLAANRQRCIGMAANMIGVNKRIIIASLVVADVVMYNPVLIKGEDPFEVQERCLSLDGARKATRFRAIEVEYLDEGWNRRREKFYDTTAHIIQHELDHLEGILI